MGKMRQPLDVTCQNNRGRHTLVINTVIILTQSIYQGALGKGWKTLKYVNNIHEVKNEIVVHLELIRKHVYIHLCIYAYIVYVEKLVSFK